MSSEEPSKNPDNKGALTPTALVDGLCMTFPGLETPKHVLPMFGAQHLWTRKGRGGHGYHRSYIRDGISVLYDGAAGMGVHVAVTGTGCRHLEQEGLVSGWRELLCDLLLQGAQFSRIDVALDDYTGTLRMDEILRCLREGLVVSRFSGGRLESGFAAGKEFETTGTTVYFGSMKSNTQVCIYDKAAEQGVNQHWMRVEPRFRKEQAQQLVEAVVQNGMPAVAERLQACLDFKVAGSTGRRDRWTTQPWWSEFLGNCRKLRFKKAPSPRTLEELIQNLVSQRGRAILRIAEELGDRGLQDLAHRARQLYGDRPS